MYYPSSENKGADQLRGYREADLRLLFSPMQIVGFPMRQLKLFIVPIDSTSHDVMKWSEAIVSNFDWATTYSEEFIGSVKRSTFFT